MKRAIIIPALLLSVIVYSQELPCKVKYKNGRCKERYRENSQGAIHGTFIEYYDDGTRKTVGNYTNGIKNGRWIYYDGITEDAFTYVNGVLEGSNKITYLNFNKVGGGNYSKGKMIGYWKDNAEEIDGQLYFQEGTYVNDVREGKWLNVGKVPDKDRYLLGDKGGILYDTKIGTTKGGYVVYSKGEIVKYFNDKGEDIEKIAAEKLEKENQQKEKERIALQQIQEKERMKAKEEEAAKAKFDAEAPIRALTEMESKRPTSPDPYSIKFKPNSYILKEESQLALEKLAKHIELYNANNNDPITDIYILAHSHKGIEKDKDDQKKQLESIFFISLNRAVWIKNSLSRTLKNINFHLIPVSASMPKGTMAAQNIRTEIFFTTNETVSQGKKHFSELAAKYKVPQNNGEYSGNQIMPNYTLREQVMSNIEKLLESGNPGKQIPLELWDKELGRYEVDLDKFKAKVIQIVGNEKDAEEFVDN